MAGVGLWAPPVYQVRGASPVSLVSEERQAHRDRLDLREIKGLRVPRDPPDRQASQDNKDSLGSEGHRDQAEWREPQDLLVSSCHTITKGFSQSNMKCYTFSTSNYKYINW